MSPETCEATRSVGWADHRSESLAAVPRTAVIAVDTDARVIDMNGAAVAMVGADLSELKGKPVQEAIRNPGLCTLVTSALVSAGTLGSWVTLDDGREVFLSAYAGPLANGTDADAGALV
ncbi:MAG: PAS domain-containing protein, partial [Candidatus Brocadiae bacterium]|nr:PAS domain-containing protein [Candidatus Brocadiia bacterium]